MLDYTIYLIALSLAIDCFIVSITLASTLKLSRIYYYLIPIHFGIFQGGMALIGYFLGSSFLDLIKEFDHWIAFGLLFIVGTKMIIESFQRKKKSYSKVSYLLVIILSIATSIDALAIGITFSIIDGMILQKSLIIGAFSLILTTFGLIIGKRIKKFKFQNLGIIGGLVLIGIGVKILVEHLV
jgi:putative Mn2+ efflux pump MntP